MVRGIEKFGYVYIMTNKNKTVLYIGVTNNLVRRVYEHKNHIFKNSFTDKYNCEYCIYYEEFVCFDLAIAREKELKKWNRQKKEALINSKNPEWKELVTERGFVREKQEIPRFRLEMIGESNDEIPRFRLEMTGESNDEIPRFRLEMTGKSNDEIPRFRLEMTGKSNDEIPRCARNDGDDSSDYMGGVGGGVAAANSSLPNNESVIPNVAQRNEESDETLCEGIFNVEIKKYDRK